MGEIIPGNGSDNEDFCCECSDEEKYNPSNSETKQWEPDPKDIKLMYEKLSRGERLELEWKCPGRRSLTPERKEETMDEDGGLGKEEKMEEKVEPTEFDFDEAGFDANPITPRRTPGSAKAPRSSQKRVARLDKIMDDIRRHKKIEETSKSREKGSSRSGSPRAGSPVAATGEASTPLKPTGKGRMSPKKLS